MAWRIDLTLFTSLAQRHQVLVHKLRSFVREYLQTLLLRFYPQLMSLSEPERDLLLQTFLLQSIEPNGTILQQGSPSPPLIPAYGEALVFTSQGGAMQVWVAELPKAISAAHAPFLAASPFSLHHPHPRRRLCLSPRRPRTSTPPTTSPQPLPQTLRTPTTPLLAHSPPRKASVRCILILQRSIRISRIFGL